MKSGYKTIPEEEESKPLTKAGIPETGGSRMTKKHMVLISLGFVIMVLLMGHLTNTHHSGLRMNQESTTAQLVDSKEEDVSTAWATINLSQGPHPICEVCSNGHVPGNAHTLISMGSEKLTCQALWEKGQKGNLKLCNFLQSFASEPCGCDVEKAP